MNTTLKNSKEQLLEDLINSIQIFSYTRFEDNSNGPYEQHCPFCDCYETYGGNETPPGMSDITHEDECPYIILDKYFNPELYI